MVAIPPARKWAVVYAFTDQRCQALHFARGHGDGGHGIGRMKRRFLPSQVTTAIGAHLACDKGMRRRLAMRQAVRSCFRRYLYRHDGRLEVSARR